MIAIFLAFTARETAYILADVILDVSLFTCTNYIVINAYSGFKSMKAVFLGAR